MLKIEDSAAKLIALKTVSGEGHPPLSWPTAVAAC